ncbi:MAG: NFYB/HAP3 family transcription factor subunit [Candidatus Micrarchaeota archaeon]|nr:NFYB/HAP3 family transcription factor subunit [Candidatus Micrarchaeota archaeon]MDE1848022.1 NFYB/HAP3 family transcription factor subunit [Candidatus Micrarchaeota archaeon]MDE1864601.1 NFYB/HAP3 family transcription factor subunit [Candidatus Micrarchaeota archaeon]
MKITKATAKRILKEAGAIRVSDPAASEFARTLNNFAYSIAGKAAKLCAHAKRKTVEKSDIELAK